MGTCKLEQDGQVFAAQQMANELGVGIQFEKAEGEIYDKHTIVNEETGEKGKTGAGITRQAGAHVPPSTVDDLEIKVLFFMFYTQIPESGSKKRIDKTAQQPYVHAKLMVEDDAFFTLGSANLNIRSMAVDSELNLISDDFNTAQDFRHTLLGTYFGYDPKAEEDKFFPNKRYNYNQGVCSIDMQDDLKKIFQDATNIAEKNRDRIGKEVRIQGYVATFKDDRSALGMRVG